jgi:hypothetical protein
VTNTASSGLLVIILVVAGAIFAPKLFGMVGSLISEVTGANDAKIIGEGATAIMVSANTSPKVAPCKTEKILEEKQCAGLRILTVDASRMPFIARNTKLAWESGRPALLTMNRSKENSNRAAACSKFTRSYEKGSCDEYPMASTNEGGPEARIDEVPQREINARVGHIAGSIRRMGRSSW